MPLLITNNNNTNTNLKEQEQQQQHQLDENQHQSSNKKHSTLNKICFNGHNSVSCSAKLQFATTNMNSNKINNTNNNNNNVNNLLTNNNSSIFRVSANQNNINNNVNNLINYNNPRHSLQVPNPSKSSMMPIHSNSISSSSTPTANFRSNSNNLINLKTRRSGSITSFLPVKESTTNNTSLPAIMFRNKQQKQALQNNNHSSQTPNGQSSNQFISLSKRSKSNSLSIIDYCNIINMNTNFQMLSHFYDDTEESMARLSMKTTRNGNIQKQATLSEQLAQLFGSTMCSCFLCKMKSIDAKKSQQHNFEIMPNNHNSEYTMAKYTYSTPYSQMSCLKLFNLMNTDCSIYIGNESFSNQDITSNITSTNTNSSVTTLPPLPNQTNVINSNNDTSNSLQTNQSLNVNNSNNNNNNNNNGNNSNTSSNNQPPTTPLQSFMHSNSNSPPIYDLRYLYLIDCRLNKKQFDKSKINTAIHYSDLLDDSVYLSPPTDNYTLIVLYDEDGTFLSSSSHPLNGSSNNSSSASLANNYNSSNNYVYCNETITSDELIAKIKAKISCNQSKTIYILSGGFEQFYSRFPYMCSNMEIRSTADRHKHLTIYPNCVIENQIYIGSGIQAKNWRIIRDLKITHIINASVEHECVFKDEIKYLHIKLEDNYTENIYKVFNKSIQFIDDAFEKYYSDLAKINNKENGNNGGGLDNSTSNIQPPVIMIHCNLGISRSSTVLIAYLMSRYKLCLFSAFKYVKDKRLQIAPNYSFLRQLKQFEETF